MKKRLCAAFLSCMMLFTGIPVNAEEGENTELAEEIILDESGALEESTEEVSEDFPEESESEEAEDILPTDWESDWLSRYNLTKTEDGNYQTTDEDGHTWEYSADDPELFKYFPIEYEDQDLILLDISEDEEGLFTAAGNSDPHVFRLDTSRRYAYPAHYKTDDDSKRVDIHYGIDISYYQKKISKDSFSRMKNDYGLEFVIIRAGFRGYGDAGNMVADDCFGNNATNAAAAGLKVGVYFFSQAITEAEAEQEANYCLELIAPYKSLVALPVYIDYEYNGNPGRLKKAGLSAKSHTDICNRFCTVVRNGGYSAGIYANKSMLCDDMVISDIPDNNYIWMAHYPDMNSEGVYATNYSKRLETWQFTSKFAGFPSGMVATDTVDFDFWFGDYNRTPDSLKYNANGGTGKTAATKGYTGKEVTVAKCGFNYAGSKFIRWDTRPDGSGVSYNPGDKYTLTEGEDLLYAIWEIQSYTLTFDSRGGSSVDSVTAVYDSKVDRPGDPVREDYIFTGWYKDPDCIYPWDFDNDTLRRDTVLYAGWKLEEALDWGDLDLPENADIKALYESPDKVPAEIMVFDVPESVDYRGSAVTFGGFRVFYGTKKLQAARDFTVKYKNNVNAGKSDSDKAQLIITGKGNYTGKRVVTFSILPLDITGRLLAPDIRLVYTGKAQKGTTTVSFVKEDGTTTLLEAGKDFDYGYEGTMLGSASEDTDYTVTITGKGNYTGKGSFTETILRKETDKIPVSKLKIKKIKAQKLGLDEEGNIIPAEPILSVSYKKEAVNQTSAEDNEDGYVIEKYTDNIAAGTASVYIRGTGKYTGVRRVTFKVKAIPMKSVNATLAQKFFDYTGKAVTFEGGYSLTYTDEKGVLHSLKENEHFTVSYEGNEKSGKKAAVVFTGTGAFSGSLKKTFTINPVSLKNSAIKVDMDKTVYFCIDGVKPRVSVTYEAGGDSYSLVEGKDYTLKYAGNTVITKDGSKKPSVTITGKGGFKGSIKEEFVILRENLGMLKISAADVAFKNKAGNYKTKVTIYDINGKKLTEGTDFEKNLIYTFAEDNDLGKAGDYVHSNDMVPTGTRIRAAVVGKGNFEGEGFAEFTIVPASIAKAKVKISDQIYTGRAVTIDKADIISVTLGKNLLGAGDYEIVPGSYRANINKGTAKVTLRGAGNYGGTVVATFKIVAKPVNSQ